MGLGDGRQSAGEAGRVVLQRRSAERRAAGSRSLRRHVPPGGRPLALLIRRVGIRTPMTTTISLSIPLKYIITLTAQYSNAPAVSLSPLPYVHGQLPTNNLQCFLPPALPAPPHPVQRAPS